MLDSDDLKWTASNLIALHRRLQEVSRLSAQAGQAHGVGEDLRLLDKEVEQARKTAQALLDRITSRLLAGTRRIDTAPGTPPIFRVMPPASLGSTPVAGVEARIPVGELALAAVPDGGIVIRNPEGRGKLVLVVDDEPEILERAGLMLEEEGFRIILAKDGFEALQIYGQLSDKISLIILDFFLPVMDGDAVFDELKAINPNVQVVLSSGFAEQTKLGSMLARGLCGFIPKPYTSEKLIDQVRSIIAA
ncbi:MAG: response regulator [Chthoniobacterales bacterium]|nr:response regulator [Chthoniobacterales bacterium]